jgi:hypothetical protein
MKMLTIWRPYCMDAIMDAIQSNRPILGRKASQFQPHLVKNGIQLGFCCLTHPKGVHYASRLQVRERGGERFDILPQVDEPTVPI